MAARLRRVLGLLGVVLVLTGCACPGRAQRSFDLGADSFAFSNGLRWEYEFPASGGVVTRKNEPPPEYSLRCFPMTRAAREFFYHAEFQPHQPLLGDEDYRTLVRKVVGRSSRCPSAAGERIVIPGFADLHAFSAAHGDLLRAECGGAAASFLQRGNWRMVFPQTGSGRRKTADRFVDKLGKGQLAIAHIYQFPNTALNHALLIYAAREEGSIIAFSAYDPNDPGRAAHLRFDREANTFAFERNRYFGGGEVRVYEVYRDAFY